jgi:hypothetical protein
MKMLSSRHAPLVLVMLLVALIPTVIHSYLDSSVSDGRLAAAIPARLGGEAGVPTTRRPGWGMDRLAAHDWIERSFGPAPAVRLFVGRSFDLKKLYHHPELAVDYGPDYGRTTTISLPQRPGLPVHLLVASSGNRDRVSMYALSYDDQFVGDPIAFQLRTSLQLVFSGRRPMTLFFVTQDLAERADPATSRAAAILLDAIAAFEGAHQ